MKLIYILLVALVCYSLPFFFSDELISPDNLVYDFFSTHLAETGKLGYRPPGDEIFGRPGFTPRYFVYNSEGETYPRKFPGFIIFWAGLKWILPPQASRLAAPLCAVLSLLILFFIGKEVFPDLKTPLRGVILLATTPVFIRRAFVYNATLLNLAVFLAALYFLLRALRNRGLSSYLLFGIFAGALIWIRPTNAIYLLSLFILILIERGSVVGKWLIVAVIMIVLFGGGLLLYNYTVYGSFFNLGYTTTLQPSEITVSAKAPLSIRRILEYLNFHPRIWLLHLKNAPLSLSLAFPLLILSLIGFFIPRRRKAAPIAEGSGQSAGEYGEDTTEDEAGMNPGGLIRFNLYYFWLFIISVLFFSNFGTFGSERGEFTLNSSFLRYLMPTICLLPLFAARALSRLSFPAVRLMMVLAVFNIIIALIAPGGAIETITQSRYYGECRRFLLDQTDDRTVFFTYYWDKLVFPERMVYTHGTQFPSDEIDEVIRRVKEKGYRIVYPFNICDSVIRDILVKNYVVEEIDGPDRLSPLTRRAAQFIPGHLYPLKLYKVTGDKKKQPVTGNL
ncbi:MAG: glycosyltransferase family 39 protein [Candidatus Euphemobacter frigidus]|nr:glycosyltransferase family 39 protein [Candidatus Euphemobacter frigidus]MDP8275929.1 glycosyltransferase family 39 protein [Candidatus Euphemobacter frigidus]